MWPSPGRADENVYAAKTVDGLQHDGRGAVVAGDVPLHRYRLAARLGYCGGDRRRAVSIQVCDGDPRSLVGEKQTGRLAYPGAAARPPGAALPFKTSAQSTTVPALPEEGYDQSRLGEDHTQYRPLS